MVGGEAHKRIVDTLLVAFMATRDRSSLDIALRWLVCRLGLWRYPPAQADLCMLTTIDGVEGRLEGVSFFDRGVCFSSRCLELRTAWLACIARNEGPRR